MDRYNLIHQKIRSIYNEDSAIMTDGKIKLLESQRFLTEEELVQVLPTAAEEIKMYITARRNIALEAGIVVGGFPVQTDNLSQQRITGAALAALIDPTMTVQWKLGNGDFVELDAPTIIAIAQSIRAHVQACFDHEKTLQELVDNGETPDINAGWPTSVS